MKALGCGTVLFCFLMLYKTLYQSLIYKNGEYAVLKYVV